MTHGALGLDVSGIQGDIDWARRSCGFAYIRASKGEMADERFEQNAKGASDAGIYWGAYHELRGDSVSEALRQADRLLKLLDKTEPALSCALWIDDESVIGTRDRNGRLRGALPQSRQFALIETFLERVSAQGRGGMAYMTDAAMSRLYRTDAARLCRWKLWVCAPEKKRPRFGGPWSVWQYTCSANVPGIGSAVSLDYAERELFA